MKQTIYKVTEQSELLPFLAKQMPGVSRTKLKEILAHEVYVDSHKVSQFDFPLQPGMSVSLRRKGYYERFTPRNLDIVFEDEYLIVVNKHDGILSNSAIPSQETVITVLNKYFNYTHQRCYAHIVHRLDRDTSGLLVVSKSKRVSQAFEADWKGMVYDRAYVAVAWGDIQPDSGTIRSWLTDGRYCVLSSPTDNGGKEAVTHYRVMRRTPHFSLVELKLDTGRRNQIRVHLSREMQHPVVKDPIYGYKDDAAPIARLALHAYRLCFRHPVTGRDLKFETPFPSSFMRLLDGDR